MSQDLASKKNVSKSAIRRAIYKAVTAVAQPGDVCFFVTEDPECYRQLSRVERMYRKWMGFAQDDISIWHLGILSKFEKKPKSSQIRPYIIHSIEQKGVIEQHVSPEYFTSRKMTQGEDTRITVMEVLRYEGITHEQSNRLVEFCRQQIGKPFPKSIRGESLTYILGLPNFLTPPNEYSCHSLVYAAFDHIGIDFPHHLEAAPFFNIGKYLGHPLKHERQKVNPNYPYLRDHCIYKDHRFTSIISLTWDQCTNEILISEKPNKYSWDPRLAEVYKSEIMSSAMPS